MTSVPLICLTARAGLVWKFLLAGAALLMLDGNLLAETLVKPEKTNRILIVSDSVQLAGSKLSGGWREYAVDGSWRSVAFVLDGHVASVTFGDGKNGRRVPSVTRYIYTGPGGKDAKAGDAPAVYSEAHSFADATPEIRDRANRSSSVPADVATRIRELGGDIKLMQQAADIKRISELGSALDAARGAADKGGVFGDRPGGPPRRSGGGWSRPGAGVGGDGSASDGTAKIPGHDGGPKDTVERHADGSTTETTYSHDANGGHGFEMTDRDASGRVTGRTSYAESENGDKNMTISQVDPRTGTTTTHVHIDYHDGTSQDYVEKYRGGRRVRTPSEVPFSGRGGFDEAWMDKSLPWFMDGVYLQWKRENDLKTSGGRIAQPGRGETPPPDVNEGPRVGAGAVTNCGDTGTNPCARFEGTEVDTRERIGGLLSQPPLGDPRGGPGGMGVPNPLPIPPPKK